MHWLDAVPPERRLAPSDAGPPPPGASIGLVAGWGLLPLQLARAFTARGWRVVVLGIDGEVDRSVAWGTAFHLVNPWRLGPLLELLRAEGCRDVVLAGKVHRSALWGRFLLLRHRPDLAFLRLWWRLLRDRRDGTVLRAVARVLEDEEGLRLRSAAELCPELLAPRGSIGLRSPTARERADASAGWRVARELSRLDVGQAVVVRDRVVLALEAVEGTDATIRRASQFAPQGGFGLVKVARPGQDMRLDAPAVGPRTIRLVADAGGTFVAIEAERTLLVHMEEAVAIADDRGIALFGLTEQDVGSEA